MANLRLFTSWLLGCGLVSLPLDAGHAEDSLLYTSKSFEAPLFSPGLIEGQDVWQIRPAPDVDPGAAVIQETVVFEGGQALQLRNTGARAMATLRLPCEQPFFLDFQLFMPQGGEILTNPEFFFRGRTASGKFEDFVMTQFTKAGNIPNLSAPAPRKIQPGQWNRVTFRVDPAAASWDLHINGEQVASGEPTKTGETFSKIEYIDFSWTGSEKFPDGGVFIDNVTLSLDKPRFD